eukprot:3064682-Pyramimonas_sp.AAC.1
MGWGVAEVSGAGPLGAGRGGLRASRAGSVLRASLGRERRRRPRSVQRRRWLGQLPPNSTEALGLSRERGH